MWGQRMEMRLLLKKIAIKLILPYELVRLYRRCNQIRLKLKKRKLLRFDVHLAEHCNLNCKSCEHFSPLSPKSFLDLNIYEKDCERLSKLTGGIVEDIAFVGGEPLLYPRLTDVMDMTRKYFPVGMIRIITNGILLMTQPEAFWESCRKNDITIYISVYPVKINYFDIKNKTEIYGIKLVFWGDPIHEQKDWRKLPIDITGKQNRIISNMLCYMSNHCFQLVDGKLYKCCRVAYIKYFNNFFKQNLQVSEKDYFDIYKENDINKILNQIRKPVPFCRYCNMIKGVTAQWGESNYEISEWV